MAGCNKHEKKKGWVVESGNTKQIAEMMPNDVIVSVNGENLTLEKYKKLVGVVENRIKTSAVRPEVRDAVIKERSRTIIYDYINRQLLLSEAKRRNLTPAPADIASAKEPFEATAKKRGKSLIQLAQEMGDTEKELDQKIAERATINILLKKELGNKLEVTEEDMEAGRLQIAEYNAMCDATNQLVMARGQQLMKEISEGQDFDLLALAVSESGELDSTLWGEFTRAELENQELREAAFTKPVGSVAGPFDTDEGLAIIKIVDRAVGGQDSPNELEYVELNRILLRMGLKKEIPSDEQLRQDLLKKKREKHLVPFIDALKEKFTVKFPHGSQLWEPQKKKTTDRGVEK